MAVKFQQLSAWSTGPGVSTPRNNSRNQSDSGPFEGVRTIEGSVCFNRYGLTGDKNSGLLFGGVSFPSITSIPALDNTEEYDGNTWATSNAMTVTGVFTTGVGSQNATLATAFGNPNGAHTHCESADAACDEAIHTDVINNHCSPAETTSQFHGDASLEYNGTTWDATATDIAAADGTRCQNLNGGIVGEMTNALVFGGGGYCCCASTISNSHGAFTTTTQDRIYNGTSWSVTGNTLNTNRLTGMSFGNAESSLYAGGHSIAVSPVAPSVGKGGLFDAGPSLSCVEEYNGTTWSAVNQLPIARHDGGGSGTQNDGIIFGGHNLSEGIAQQENVCARVSSYFGLYTQHYDGISWKNASGLMNNHRWGVQGTGGTSGAGLAGVGMGRTHTPAQSSSPNNNEEAICDGTGRGNSQPTTNAWYNEYADYCIAHSTPSYTAKAVSYINNVEEYNVTAGGVQFGPRISGFQLSTIWDAGNYKNFSSIDEGSDNSDGIVGKFGTNDFYANTNMTASVFSGSIAGTDYGQYTAGAPSGEDVSLGGGLFGTGYVSGSVQFKGWSVGPDLQHVGAIYSECALPTRSTKARGVMAAGKQDSMIVMGGHGVIDNNLFGGTFLCAKSSIYDGTAYSEGPAMHRAISHGAAAGKDSENAIIVGSHQTTLKGVVAVGGCGALDGVKSARISGADILNEGHFLGRSQANNSTFQSCIDAGCHAGATPGDINVSAPTLNDWTGDKGGYNTPFKNPNFPTLPDACIEMTHQVSHLDGTTWSDGGALPVGVYGVMRNPRIPESAVNDIGEDEKAFNNGVTCLDSQQGSHGFIGPRMTVGGPSNALFICDQNGQNLTNGVTDGENYISSPYLRQDKAVKYNGTSWTSVNSPLHSGLFRGNAMAGNPESAIRVMGKAVRFGSDGTVNDCKVEEYDGVVWSQLPNQLLPRNYAGWTGNDSLAGHIWGGSGVAVQGSDNYARSDSWDGNAWAASCAMIQHVPREIVTSGLYQSGDLGGVAARCEIQEGKQAPAEAAAGQRAQISRAGVGTTTGTDDVLHEEGCSLNLGYGESWAADGVGTTNSAYAAAGFVIPTWRLGGNFDSPSNSVPNYGAKVTGGTMQTTFWNDTSLRDLKNNLHFNATGSSFQPKEAILDCPTVITEAPDGSDNKLVFGSGYAADFNDARINTSFQEKNHYVELDGSGSLESDYYMSIDSTGVGSGDTGFENCLFPRVWSVENPLTQERIFMNGAGTPEGALVAGGQSCSPGNASIDTYNDTELWDGQQFSAGPTLPASTRRHVTLGSKNHAHVFGGYCPGSSPASANLQDSIQEYLNGTWSGEIATLSLPRAHGMGAGAAGGWILWGGHSVGCTNNNYGQNLTDCVELYNGQTVSAGTNTPTVLGQAAAVGSQNAALNVAGLDSNNSNTATISPSTDLTCATVKWDGSSWSAGPDSLKCINMNTGAGTQNASVFWGGNASPALYSSPSSCNGIFQGSNSPGNAKNASNSGYEPTVQEFDGTAFSNAARLPVQNSIGSVTSTSNSAATDGFGNAQNSAMALGKGTTTFQKQPLSFIYSDYKHKSIDKRIAADKTSGGLTISMWVRMPRTADSYSDADPAWDNKIYLAANADVDVASPFIGATPDVPRSGVRLLRYYTGSGDRIRLEWQNRATSGLGSSYYAWDSNGNQDIISYFQTSEDQTFAITDWYNIVAVVSFERSDTTNKIFINGVSKTLSISNQTTTTFEDVRYPGNYTSRFRVGRFAGHKYQLDVANVMYYTRQLSDDEVLQNYKTLLPRFI